MEKFLNRLLLFLAVTIIVIGLCLFSVNRWLDQSGYYQLDQSKSILIVGHSHAECAYNDSLIDGAINMASSGESYYYTYFKLKRLLTYNSQIKTVFVEYANNQITHEMDKWTWEHKFVHNNYPKYSAIIPVNEQLVLLKNWRALCSVQPVNFKSDVEFILGKNQSFINALQWGGYVYLQRDKTDSLLLAYQKYGYKPNPDHAEKSELNIKYLEKIVALCKEHKVQVIFIRTPFHKLSSEYLNESMYTDVLNTSLKGEVFIDLRELKFKDEEYGDLEHLNHKGARRYSLFFNTLIKDGLIDAKEKKAFIEKEISNSDLK